MSNLVPQGIYCVGIPAPFLTQGMTELSHSELRVMLYIYLHTLGYQKSADSLTYNQIIGGITTREGKQLDKGAGVSRRSLVEALQGLEKKGYIQRQAGTGANFASGKIAIRFNAPEFQIQKNSQEAQTIEQTEEIETPVPNLAKAANKIPNSAMQKIHQSKVQILHSSCMNQHVLNHDDDKEVSTPKIKADCKTAVSYLLQNIPNLAEHDASQLVYIALVKNSRNLDYLKQLVGYILSRPKIHTPAAVLTKLIKNNSQRGLVISKNPQQGNSRKASRTIQQNQSFPFASKVVAVSKASANLDSANLVTNFSEKLATAINPKLAQRIVKSAKNHAHKATLGFTQASFDWFEQTIQADFVGLSVESAISDFSTKPTYISSIPAPAVTKQYANAKGLPDLKAVLSRLQDDIRGRLRFSVSNQLASLLEGASLELVRQEQGIQIIRLKFLAEFAERLISPQDYQVIKLSLSQQLGCNYILQMEDVSKTLANYAFPVDVSVGSLYQAVSR